MKSLSKNKDVCNEIQKKLTSYSENELVLINQLLERLFPKSGKIATHLLGNFLNITVNKNSYYMKLSTENENIYGIAHGGAIYTLVDMAIGFKIIEYFDHEVDTFTQELKINYVKKGKGEYLHANPIILHIGKKTVICECDVKDDYGDLVAKAMGTFYYN